MNKLFKASLLFMIIVISGCSEEDILQIKIHQMESFSESKEKNELVISDSKDIRVIRVAFKKAKKLPGIADMADPHYKVIVGDNEELYFLWLHEKQGTIMNLKDTHTIYSLSEPSVGKLNEILKGP